MTAKTKPQRKTTKEERYRLTPKGIFTTCLMDAFNFAFDDRRITIAWELFEARMKCHGYVQD